MLKRILLFASLSLFLLPSCKNQNNSTQTSSESKMSCRSCCQANQKTDSKEEISSNDTKIIYFHFTRRCITCKSVEKIAHSVANKHKQVSFKSYNIEDEEVKQIAQEYGVSGQALLVIKANKVENLTTYAFMNAKTRPEMLANKLEVYIKK